MISVSEKEILVMGVMNIVVGVQPDKKIETILKHLKQRGQSTELVTLKEGLRNPRSRR